MGHLYLMLGSPDTIVYKLIHVGEFSFVYLPIKCCHQYFFGLALNTYAVNCKALLNSRHGSVGNWLTGSVCELNPNHSEVEVAGKCLLTQG